MIVCTLELDWWWGMIAVVDIGVFQMTMWKQQQQINKASRGAVYRWKGAGTGGGI